MTEIVDFACDATSLQKRKELNLLFRSVTLGQTNNKLCAFS
jgi:hypothetical protein